ncbi:MAG: VWA domain-containing protein [Actinobacteria bacterium]|nr:VWA domain-containing protein [Actinomycetota bacterium]
MFASPGFLAGLLLVPLLVAGYFFAQRRRARYAVRFTNVEVLASVVGPRPSWRRYLPPALFLLGLIALLLGLARPQGTVLVPREKATVVLSLDVSGSMKATDVEPSRLSAAQSAASKFVVQLPDEFQVGLVTFSGEAEILAQPTTDRVAVSEGIESLRASGATAMGDAIIEALRLTRPPDSKGKGAARERPRTDTRPRGDRPLEAILLLSDGYNTSGEVEPLGAAQRARAEGVPVFAIALGTPEGVVEVPDSFGGRRLVRVPPDYETLQQIAETTGGEYYFAPTEDDLRRIYDNLGSRIGFVPERQEITFVFAAAGLVFAAAAGALTLLWSGRFP